MLKIYNSLSNKKEIFRPRKGKRVNMFVCGITPYDSPHIGNFRAAIVYDLIARHLRFAGYDVFYLQNVTDIDDKIIKSAKARDKSWKEIGDYYFKEYLAIGKKLNITSVTKYAKATAHIKEIIAQIETLIKKGYGYEKNGSVYFEVSKFKNYGKLSRQNLKKLYAGARLEEDPDKKHPYDFVLWKARESLGRETSKYEPAWKSPWGLGRPGWHIEDTAISEHYFGPQYDIHGGAVELKFPHHEAEVAQQESASGKKPFVKYWAHCGILLINGEKMSKSLGNFITGKEMVEKYDPDYFCFMIVSAHYRSPIDYSEKLIHQAKTNLENIRNFARELKKIKQKTGAPFDIADFKKQLSQAMDDDFNTPKALAVIFKTMRQANTLLSRGKLSTDAAKEIISFLKNAEAIFGVSFIKIKTAEIPPRIKELAEKRELFRKEKRWAEADAIREQIQKEGYEIKDSEIGYKIDLLRNNFRSENYYATGLITPIV